MHLYDQIVTKLPRVCFRVVFFLRTHLLLQDDREGNNTVREHIGKQWLGSLQLPFTTIYYSGKVNE